MAGRSSIIVVVVAALLGVCPDARAQTAADKAAAEALSAHGQRLMAANQVAAACQKLEVSVQLNPVLDTRLELADCLEKLGRTASAWALFREAAAAAQAAGSPEREQTARTRAATLEGRLSTIRLAAPDDVQVFWDGKALDRAVLGTPIPVDPGKHFIEAKGPGKSPYAKVLEILHDRTKAELEIPELSPWPGAAASGISDAGSSPSGSSAGSSPSAATVTPPRTPDNGNGQRVLGIGVGVVGLAGAGLAIFFAGRASSTWNEARSHCSSYPDHCDAEAVRLSQDAREAGNLATVATVLGAAGILGGTVLWFTAARPKPASERPLLGGGHEPSWTVGLGASQLVVRGAF